MKRNDEERRLWILNDEGLYLWWRRECRGERYLATFIRKNRAEIDAIIDGTLAKY